MFKWFLYKNISRCDDFILRIVKFLMLRFCFEVGWLWTFSEKMYIIVKFFWEFKNGSSANHKMGRWEALVG